MRRQRGSRFRQTFNLCYAYGRNGKAARPARFVIRITPRPNRICRRRSGLIGLSQERCRAFPAGIRISCAAFRRAPGSRHGLEFFTLPRPRARGTRPPHQFRGWNNRSRSRNAEARRTREPRPSRNRASALHQERVRFLACHDLAAVAKLLARFPGVWLTGNYLRGPAIGSCVEQALAVAEEVRESLSP